MRDRTNAFLNCATSLSNASSPSSSTTSTSPASAPKRKLIKPTASSLASTLLGRCHTVYYTLQTLDKLLERNSVRYLAGDDLMMVSSTATKMTDSERDVFDREVNSTAAKCQASISAVKADIMASAKKNTDLKNLDHRTQHFNSIIVFLEEYLEKLVSIHSTWKFERIQQRTEQRIGYVRRPLVLTSPSTVTRDEELVAGSTVKSPLVSPTVRRNASDTALEEESAKRIVGAVAGSSSSLSPPAKAPHALMGAVLEVDQQLDPKRQEMLLMENSKLQRHLHTMVEQIKDVENQVAAIAHANAFISQNIARSKEDLELIQGQSVEIQSHFSAGNMNLQQAAQSGVTFRIFVLLFLLSLSASLLIMHWTYD